MLKDASRRKFDIVMARAIDRLGRSLSDLLDTIQHLEACGVDLYLDQQAIDTTTPIGKLVFQLTGAFAGFERTMIRQRVSQPQASGCSGREARPGYLEGGEIARHRNWYGAAHLKGASNEPARGAAMTSGPSSPTVCYGALDPPVGGSANFSSPYLLLCGSADSSFCNAPRKLTKCCREGSMRSRTVTFSQQAGRSTKGPSGMVRRFKISYATF